MNKLCNKRSLCWVTLALGLVASSQASATIFTYDITNPPGSDGAGDVTAFSTSYNDVTQQLSWSSTVAESSGNLADGFWLVLSDGPNPKDNVNEYAIFYGDSHTGNLTSYVYNGANSSSSWSTPGELIQSFAGGLSFDSSVAGENTFSFSIDASFINAYVPTTPGTNDWDGASFGESIGIWYHPALFGANPTYNPDGSLASFPVAKGSWYDTSDRDTTTVPAPAIPLLLITGLIGMIAIKRRHT